MYGAALFHPPNYRVKLKHTRFDHKIPKKKKTKNTKMRREVRPKPTGCIRCPATRSLLKFITIESR